MDPSSHGGGAADGSADGHSQMWVRGARLVCVDPRLWGTGLRSRFCLRGRRFWFGTDAPPSSDDARPRAVVPAS